MQRFLVCCALLAAAPLATANANAQSDARAFATDVHVALVDSVNAFSPVARGATREMKADEGEGIRVAIISTGVDYTHAALGGSGKADDYQDALINHANAWSGFPTAVVVDGRDFAGGSNGFASDLNPIERDVLNAAYPTGEGTAMADIVHSLAPNAKIVALKVSEISETGTIRTLGSGGPTEKALEYALDPNGDGNFSDKADIVVVPARHFLNAFGAQYHDNAGSTSAYIANAMRLQALAAQGVLVITDVGENEAGKYSLAYSAAAPDVLTVGYTGVTEGEENYLARASAKGPVRGTEQIKPEIVASITAETAVAGSGDERRETASPAVALAEVAGHAAVLMSRHPELSAGDVRRLLVNTAVPHTLLEGARSDPHPAPPTSVGNGLPAPDGANHSAALVYVNETGQPSLSLGMIETVEPVSVTRHFRLRNFSDADSRFSIQVVFRDEAEAGQLDWVYPSEIHVPAGGSVSVPATVHVDPAKLAAWPLISTVDDTGVNWRKIELDGWFEFEPLDGGPVLRVPWMLKARERTDLVKHFDTLVEAGFDTNNDATEFGKRFDEFLPAELMMQVSNASSRSRTFVVMPLMHKREFVREDQEGTPFPHLLSAGGGIFDDARCESGKKLSLSAMLREPVSPGFEIAWDSYTEDFVIEKGWRNGIYDPGTVEDEMRGVTIWIETRPEGLVTKYIDMDAVIDPFNPEGRARPSRLPAYASPHSGHVLAEVCMEELFHDQFQSVEDFDERFGWLISTPVLYPHVGEPVIEFNPVLFGTREQRVFAGAVRNTVDGTLVGLRAVKDGEPYGEYGNLLEVPAGGRALVHAVRHYYCDGCGEFMFFSLEDDYGINAVSHYLDDESVVPRPAYGQRFTVNEHAANGTVIGTVRLDTDGLFAVNPNSMDGLLNKLRLMNALPGDPFALSPEGELTVVNSAALDYELAKRLVLKVQLLDGNTFSRVADVVVDIGNINDHAPVQLLPIEGVSAKAGDPVDLDLFEHFADADGDELDYVITGLPGGLTFDRRGMRVHGVITKAGRYSATLKVSDGKHTLKAALAFEINGGASGGGGGGGGSSAPLGLALFMLLAPLVRRHSGRNKR